MQPTFEQLSEVTDYLNAVHAARENGGSYANIRRPDWSPADVVLSALGYYDGRVYRWGVPRSAVDESKIQDAFACFASDHSIDADPHNVLEAMHSILQGKLAGASTSPSFGHYGATGGDLKTASDYLNSIYPGGPLGSDPLGSGMSVYTVLSALGYNPPMPPAPSSAGSARSAWFQSYDAAFNSALKDYNPHALDSSMSRGRNVTAWDAGLLAPAALVAVASSSGGPSHSNSGGTTTAAGAGTYIVQSGDTLSSIAKSHGVSLAALEAANPQIENFDLIYAGQLINIPDSSGGSQTLVNSGGYVTGTDGQDHGGQSHAPPPAGMSLGSKVAIGGGIAGLGLLGLFVIPKLTKRA